MHSSITTTPGRRGCCWTDWCYLKPSQPLVISVSSLINEPKLQTWLKARQIENKQRQESNWKRLICRTIPFIFFYYFFFLAQKAPVHAGNTLLDYSPSTPRNYKLTSTITSVENLRACPTRLPSRADFIFFVMASSGHEMVAVSHMDKMNSTFEEWMTRLRHHFLKITVVEPVLVSLMCHIYIFFLLYIYMPRIKTVKWFFIILIYHVAQKNNLKVKKKSVGTENYSLYNTQVC